jgi:probable rRNA maturation factor
MPAIDIIVESARWRSERNARALLRRVIATAAALVPTGGGELAIVLTDDSRIRALNRTWRGKDAPTNVLSFPASASAGPAPQPLGDIVIAYETTAREAKAERKPFRHHLAHLAVHGYLHLAGHDHVEDADAETMESLEITALARLKVPNPYIARTPKG